MRARKFRVTDCNIVTGLANNLEVAYDGDLHHFIFKEYFWLDIAGVAIYAFNGFQYVT